MSKDDIDKITDILIRNLPNNLKDENKPIVIDLVLDGGTFNGSYLVGALFFLKEMEKRNYIKVDRISGCSIGSLLGFLYLIDSLELGIILYEKFSKNFKENCNFEIYKDLNLYLKNRIPNDICNKINKKLYIKYNNIKKGTQKVKSVYKNENEIIESIIRSSFFPYLLDGNFVYKQKYFDGCNPYIFKRRSGKKIFFLDLCGIDKLSYALNIKNEKKNFHRVLNGLVDIYMFYIKQTETSMCSCVNDWNYSNKIRFFIRELLEKILYYIIYFLCIIQKYMHNNKYTNHIIYKILKKIMYDIFIIIINKYCV
jgi:hypothetical protein